MQTAAGLQRADQPAKHYRHRLAAGGVEQCAIGMLQDQSELRRRGISRTDHVELERSTRDLERRVALSVQLVNVLDVNLTGGGDAAKPRNLRARRPHVQIAEFATAPDHADAVLVDIA